MFKEIAEKFFDYCEGEDSNGKWAECYDKPFGNHVAVWSHFTDELEDMSLCPAMWHIANTFPGF